MIADEGDERRPKRVRRAAQVATDAGSSSAHCGAATSGRPTSAEWQQALWVLPRHKLICSGADTLLTRAVRVPVRASGTFYRFSMPPAKRKAAAKDRELAKKAAADEDAPQAAEDAAAAPDATATAAAAVTNKRARGKASRRARDAEEAAAAPAHDAGQQGAHPNEPTAEGAAAAAADDVAPMKRW